MTTANILFDAFQIFAKQARAYDSALAKASAYILESGVKQVTPEDRAGFFALSMTSKEKAIANLPKKERTEADAMALKAADNRIRQAWFRLTKVLQAAGVEIVKDARGGARPKTGASAAESAEQGDKASTPSKASALGKSAAPSAQDSTPTHLSAVADVRKLVALYGEELAQDKAVILHALARIEKWLKKDSEAML